MYPNGVGGSKGHISVFLCIQDTAALPLGWKIYTDLKFFILDRKRDKYSIFQGCVCVFLVNWIWFRKSSLVLLILFFFVI